MRITRKFGNDATALALLAQLRAIWPGIDALPSNLGFRITVESIKPQHTDVQRQGFHWLLEQWLRLDPKVARGKEALKSSVLMSMWGVIRVIDPYGNETLKPFKRTTREWCSDSGSYVDKPLTVEQYSDLIEHTYRMADPIVLPKMLTKFRRK